MEGGPGPDALHAVIEIVDIDVQKTALADLRLGFPRLAGKIRHDAHDKGKLYRALGAIDLDVVFDLHARRPVARHELLPAFACRHVLLLALADLNAVFVDSGRPFNRCAGSMRKIVRRPAAPGSSTAPGSSGAPFAAPVVSTTGRDGLAHGCRNNGRPAPGPARHRHAIRWSRRATKARMAPAGRMPGAHRSLTHPKPDR